MQWKADFALDSRSVRVRLVFFFLFEGSGKTKSWSRSSVSIFLNGFFPSSYSLFATFEGSSEKAFLSYLHLDPFHSQQQRKKNLGFWFYHGAFLASQYEKKEKATKLPLIFASRYPYMTTNKLFLKF